MRKKWVLALVIIVAVGLVGAVVLRVLHPSPQKPTLLQSISGQSEFPIYTPSHPVAGYQSDPTSYKYNSSEKVFTYVMRSDRNKITISEQTYPEILIFDKLVGTLGMYGEVQTKVGKVALARPKNLKGKQAAVLNLNNQVLVFATTENDLSADEWRQIFNDFRVVP